MFFCLLMEMKKLRIVYNFPLQPGGGLFRFFVFILNISGLGWTGKLALEIFPYCKGLPLSYTVVSLSIGFFNIRAK